MSKILVNLYIPSIGQNFDIYLSPELKVKEALPLLESTASVMSNYYYVPSGSKFVCWKEKDILLDEEQSFLDYGVSNGDHLLLI